MVTGKRLAQEAERPSKTHTSATAKFRIAVTPTAITFAAGSGIASEFLNAMVKTTLETIEIP